MAAHIIKTPAVLLCLAALLLCPAVLTGCGHPAGDASPPVSAAPATEVPDPAERPTREAPCPEPPASAEDPVPRQTELAAPESLPAPEPRALPDRASDEPAPTPETPAAPAPGPEEDPLPETDPASARYVANKNSKKFHLPTCSSVGDMQEHNKLYWGGTRDELIAQGYVPCKRCHPRRRKK